jgi:hypothetical protein
MPLPIEETEWVRSQTPHQLRHTNIHYKQNLYLLYLNSLYKTQHSH